MMSESNRVKRRLPLEILEKERRITFEEIVEMIESGAYTLEVDHPNKKNHEYGSLSGTSTESCQGRTRDHADPGIASSRNVR